MRTIKFRAITDNKELVYPDKRLFGGLDNGDLLQRFSNIEQFTGLQDKNGEDIYEGDILAPMSNDLDYKGKWVVGFEGGTFIAKCKDGDQSHWLPYWSYDICAEVEIIGNIHENPELLK